MDELKTNGAGYYDPTAYKALTRVMRKEEKTMKLYNGDIIEFEQSNGMKRIAVILAVHEKFSTVLVLAENDKLPYSVKCQGLKYTDPAMLQYTYNDAFTNLIRSMSDDEFSDIMQAVIDALGYEMPENVAKEPPKGTVEEAAPVDYVAKVQYNVEIETLQENLIQAQAERNVYKELYDNLINSMITK